MANKESQSLRTVVTAAAVGNVIEWYDFYIFGSLGAILAGKFFAGSTPVIDFLKTMIIFSAGFLIRPVGALLFGWLGDRVGRKYTFMATLMGMGLGTAVIGLVPGYASIGLSAALILLLLRLIQGLCLGGEYGGAITYVAEHTPDERRGFFTGILNTSPTIGIIFSLAVVIGVEQWMGKDAFNDWGWRIPFLISFFLVLIAGYIRLQLQETPVFAEIRAKGQMTKNPWKEAFLSANIKYVVIASIMVFGEGVVWYSSQYWTYFYLQKGAGLDLITASWIIGAGLLLGTPTLIFFGWLSDRIGRKPVLLAGLLLPALLYYPLFTWLGQVTTKGAENYVIAVIIVAILVSFVGMVYGPIGAFLAEYFPSRIRYTSVSVPYHIGNGWGGGLVPSITFAAFMSSKSLGDALIYPIVVPAICFVILLFVMPETRHISIWDSERQALKKA
jgi:MFS family permease